MKLEQQVCSLELAKRLKELGVKQESLFAWTKPLRSMPAFVDYVNNLELRRGDCSAYTVAELGEMLPFQAHTFQYDSGKWSCVLHSTDEEHFQKADTEADARAKMLVYLIENNLIEV